VSERLSRSGRDITQFGRDVLAHLRQLLVIRTVGEVPDGFSVNAADPERLRAQAAELSDLALMRSVDVIAEALAAVKEGDEPRMTLELALLRAARPQLDPTKQALLQRVEKLEEASGHRTATNPPSQQSEAPDPTSAVPESAAAEPEAGPSATAEAGAARAASAVVEEQQVELERVVELWPAVVDRVREVGSELQSTFFAAARPVTIEATDGAGRTLVIGFPPSAAFNKRKAESQEARECLAEAIRSVVGERLRPIYVLLDSNAADDAGAESQLSEEELIARLKAEFDAEEFDEAEDLDAEEEAAR
jgi:DNA polymerase III subunit gamma/tau